MNTELNNENFSEFAIKYYDNPQCHSISEFEEDIKRFLYLKKLFSRYRNTRELRERLILNHIIVLYNVFGEQTTNFLFFKMDPDDWSALTTFLIFLERMPERVEQLNINAADIVLDETIIKILRKI